MQVFKIGLLLFCGLIFMPLKSAEISAEARRFLTARPADAQQQMASAVIQALDGNFEPLNTLRQSMLIDCPPPSGVTIQNMESSGCPIRFYYPAEERSDAGKIIDEMKAYRRKLEEKSGFRSPAARMLAKSTMATRKPRPPVMP